MLQTLVKSGSVNRPKRKYISSSIALAVALSISACGGSQPSAPNTVTLPSSPVPTPSPTPTPAPTLPPSLATGEISIDVAGVTRWMTVNRATSVPSSAPLLILLHGGTGNMRTALSRTGTGDWKDIATAEKFVLIAPNGTNVDTGDTFGDNQHWNDLRPPHLEGDSDADDVLFLLKVIDWALENHDIDRSTVYITGVSNGGMMVYRMLMEAPQSFAGGAAFIANLPVDERHFVTPIEAVPLMIVNGTDDPLMPFAGGDIAQGNRGVVRSAPDTWDWWFSANHTANNSVQTTLADTDPNDGCILVQNDYAALANGAKVRTITMQGGGHAMPSTRHTAAGDAILGPTVGIRCKDHDGASIAWAFFTSGG